MKRIDVVQLFVGEKAKLIPPEHNPVHQAVSNNTLRIMELL